MSSTLRTFRSKLLDLVLDLLWRQWSAIGAFGYGGNDDDWVVDPEALLIFSCSMARYDVRLFEEMLDWLVKNGELINVNRVKTMLRREPFNGGRVLAAVADFLRENGRKSKWRALIGDASKTSEERLFFRKNGRPLKFLGRPHEIFQRHGLVCDDFVLREHARSAVVTHNPGALFKLRTLFGVSARCEIILFLLTHESSHPSRMARKIYFNQKTVQDALVEMGRSSLLSYHDSGREKHYWLDQKKWSGFLGVGKRPLRWINWPPLFSAVEQVWTTINQDGFMDLSQALRASEFRSLSKRLRRQFNETRHIYHLSDDSAFPGEDYEDVFMADFGKLLDQL